MSGTFFGFNTALKSLFAQQKAMNTASHNIANASTPGYTRQQAVMAADFAFPVPSMNRPGGAGQVGTGVNVVEMRRIRDQFLDKQIRQELATLGYWEQMAETLKLAETAFIEPSDSGLSTLFNEFWVTWQELSKNAENVAIRTSLIETSVSLAEALNHAHTQLTTIVEDLKYLANIKAVQVNTIAQQIDDLNRQIATIQLAGDAPNDLKDKRDVLLDELAKLVDFEIEETMVE
ncbi:MAG: flagellar hook-associated protein FlgK, partial [Clostridia bacterium]|nr:flagellar hook-associated protein FlgK [Clostridia bacterium]